MTLPHDWSNQKDRVMVRQKRLRRVVVVGCGASFVVFKKPQKVIILRYGTLANRCRILIKIEMSRNLNKIRMMMEHGTKQLGNNLGTTMEQHHRKGRTKKIEKTLLSLSISTEEHIIEVLII
jgi:hypothetical protein